MRGRVRAVSAITALSLAACSLAAGSEPKEVATIAFLRAVASATTSQDAILEELRAAGFTPGRNLEVLGADPADAHPDPEEAETTVRTWRRDGVDLVIAQSTSGAMAAARVDPDLVVLFISNDPVAVGLVDDEESPDGQLTGVTFRVPADRTLDVARRVIPGLQHLGFLFPEGDPAAPPHREAMTAAARELGLRLTAQPFASPEEVDAAVGALVDAEVQAMVIANAPQTFGALREIEAATAARRLPTIANTDVIQQALVILSPDTSELNRQLGRQAARLLSGATPSEVPVEDPRRFRTILDADVAAELGIELPDDVIREADEVRGGDGP